MRHVQPKLVEWSHAHVQGREGGRLMVVLAAPGCHWATTAGGCTNCSFPEFFGVGAPVSEAEYLAQLQAALSHIPPEHAGPVQLDLYVSGSFFCAEEVSPEAQSSLLRRAAQVPGVARVTVETRPEYVDRSCVARAVAAAAGVALQVAVGLESADEDIRERRIRKGFSWRDFEDAARVLAEAGVDTAVHLLLKPLDTTEAEAIEDAVHSARAVFALGEELGRAPRVSLQPCFVAPGTAVARAFERGTWRPPWLWSVVEVLRQTAHLGHMDVGLSDEGMGPAMVAHNCPACSERVRRALARFNATADLQHLAGLDCACRAQWRALAPDPGPFAAREAT